MGQITGREENTEKSGVREETSLVWSGLVWYMFVLAWIIYAYNQPTYQPINLTTTKI
jgi:hypothetical protein